MRKFLVVFAAVLFPLVADAVTFGREAAASAPRYSEAFGGQNVASLACGGESCVALWIETVHYGREGLYSSVISADGTVSPPSSNLLQSGLINSASIVWTGDHYLATWGNGAKLYSAPLGVDGRFAGEVRTVASNASFGLPSTSALAWNGRHALAVFHTSTGFVAALLDVTGALVRMLPLPISNTSVGYAAAAAGQNFAIAWTDTKFVAATSTPPPPTVGYTTVYLQRYDDSGAVIGASPIVLGSDMPVNMPKLAMAGNGSEFGVAFSTANDASMQRILVDAATGVVDRLPVVSFAPQIDGVYWSGDDFVAYTSDFNTIDTEQFSFDALRVLHVATTQAALSHIAALGSGAVIIWSDLTTSTGTMHVHGALVDRDASDLLKTGLVVSRSARPQTMPLLASSPSGPLLVWHEEQTDGVGDLLTRSVASGNPIVVRIANDVPTYGSSLAWVGNVFVVVWSSGGSILGKRLTSSGAVLDTEPVVFGKGTEAVLTSSFVAFANSDGIWLVRLNANGGAIDSEPIAVTSRIGYGLAAAETGSESVVASVIAWTEGSNWWQLPSPNYRDVFSVRIGPSGLPIDAAPIAIANTGSDEAQPAVASDGRDFLFVYTNDTKVAAKRLLREGTVVDGEAMLGTYASLPRIAFTGSRYVVTWSDYSAEQWHGLAAALDAEGRVVDPPVEFTASDSAFSVQTAVLPSVVAYSRGNAADEGIPRIFDREIVTLPAKARAVRH